MNGWTFAVRVQRLRDALFTLLVRRGFAGFGHGSRILLPSRSSRVSQIAVGRGTIIGPGSTLLVPDAATEVGVLLRLGDNVRINGTFLSAVSSVTIEDGATMGRGTYVADHSHGYDDPDVPIRDQPIVKVAPVRVGRGAWIGQNVVIMPGVQVGAGSVVGANSIVTKDVPARVVVAGSPATVIRRLDGALED